MLKKKKDIEEQVSIAIGVSKHTIPLFIEYVDSYLYDNAKYNFKGILNYTVNVNLSPTIVHSMTIPNIYNLRITENNPYITKENIIFEDKEAFFIAIEKFMDINYPRAYFPKRKVKDIWANISNPNDLDYTIDYPLVFDKRDFKNYKNVRFVFLWNSKNKQPKLLKNPYFN